VRVKERESVRVYVCVRERERVSAMVASWPYNSSSPIATPTSDEGLEFM